MAYYIIGVGIVLILLEMLTPSLFIFLSLGIATTIAGVVSIWADSLELSLIIIIILAIISFFLLKKLVKKTKKSEYSGNISEYIGKMVTIVEVTSTGYRVKIYDEIWNATSFDSFIIGEKAFISKTESTLLHIQKEFQN